MKTHDTTIELRGKVTPQGAAAVDGVRARITLPASPFGRAQMRLFPSSDQQMKQLMQSFKASFVGERPRSMNGSGREFVICEELNMLNGSTQIVSPDIQRSQIQCEPVGIWHSIESGKSVKAASSHVVFRRTPNRHLDVAAIHSAGFDGSCEVKRVRQVVVDLLPGVSLTFDTHYKWISDKRTDATTRFGFPVAIAEVAGDFHEPLRVQKQLLPKLDDLLLLASFASSHRCMCVGWQVSDSAARTSRYDRGGIGRPRRRPSPVLGTGLVPLEHFQHFLSHAWPSYQTSPYQEAIRSAVYSVVPFRTMTIESRYLSMFTALEELVLAFRKQRERVFVLPREPWSDVKCAIKEAIRTKLSTSDKVVRSMLYDNLEGINRVPLRRAIEQFVAAIGVDLVDLWPVFAGEGDGLGTIRNKLVHGDLDSTGSFASLNIATQHLSWTVERIVLALLDWPLAKSEARPDLLAQNSPYMLRLADARAEMTRVLNRRQCLRDPQG